MCVAHSPPPRLAAEVENLVLPRMFLLQEPRHFLPRVPIQMLHPRRWEAVDDDTVRYIRQVQIVPILDIPALLLGDEVAEGGEEAVEGEAEFGAEALLEPAGF